MTVAGTTTTGTTTAGTTTAGTAPATLPDRRSWVQQVMGMPASVLVRGPHARGAEADRAVRAAYEVLRRADATLSTYRPDSEISRLRDGRATLADCGPAILEVLLLCERARERTDGWFDHELPGPDGRRRLDPSGLVKAWATERAGAVLAAALPGAEWLLNVGGDVLVHGREPFGVGVQAPDDGGAVLDVVAVRRGGVATSGTYARGAHLVDPRTGATPVALASATVLGPALLEADVLATAVFAEGPAGLERLERTPGCEGLLVLPDGRLRATSGWPGARGRDGRG